ncbi:hypothetical protein [Anaeromicropila herbilytica]|uniref:Uncharacterized protein n=1 Tax=Anaeromicropila herbilytica TaxID=2785025 RepID=A0A7R7IBT4_9FIRM|nr:hypothetical protein [Anaeromicropila herbilytica]BCN29973.1 hypothetical protein bsdtb5_12680 [Anaeromicropila herbilytica]
MPDIVIKGDAAKNQLDDEKQMQVQLLEISNRIASVKGNLRFKILAAEQIGNQLEQLKSNVERHSVGMSSLSQVLNESIEKYNATENDIINHTRGENISSNESSDGKSINGRSSKSSSASKADSRGFFQKLFQDGKVDESLFNQSMAASGTLFGIDTGFERNQKGLGFTVKTGLESEWNLKKGDMQSSANFKAETYMYNEEDKAHFGIASSKFTESVGVSGVKADLVVGLMKDGKIDPSLNAKATAQAKVASASEEVQIGTDEYNAHASVEGTLGDAKAEAGIGVGDLGVDENGNKEYGVQAKVGAEASLLKGEAKTGFTVCGVKVDAGIEGKLVSVGASADVSVTDEDASVKVGASLFAGGDIKVKVDWSKFKLPEFDWPDSLSLT